MEKVQYKEPMVVRKGLDFGFNSDEIPRFWAAGNPFKTRMMDTVQATFPDGERYFVSTVNAYREHITDPDMQREVREFMQQEGQHGAVHTDYNNRLARQGIQIEVFTQRIRKISNRRLKYFSASYNVALTAAFEHFTAMMAELFFAEKEVLAGADKRVRAMMAWHAVEEMEHKAVAFDVMQKIAKVGYLKRCLAMTHAISSFTFVSLTSPWFMLRMDGFNRRTCMRHYVGGLAWLLAPRKGLFTRLIPDLLKYYQPSFHPNNQPSVHNYDAWLSSYEADGNPIGAAEAMYAAAH